MRTIIAGSRGITDPELLQDVITKIDWVPTTVISGGARGVDFIGESWAIAEGIPLKIYRADWNMHGKSAGYIRNVQMAEEADALIAIWDGESRGTKHMIDVATSKGLKIYIQIKV